MSFDPVRFVVTRTSSKETTYADVDADISTRGPQALYTEKGFLKALRKAVTKWVKETLDGKALWHMSGRDMNIGDLSSHFGGDFGRQPDDGEKPFWQYLKDVGIFHLKICITSTDEACRHWTYDTHLVDGTKLPDHLL